MKRNANYGDHKKIIMHSAKLSQSAGALLQVANTIIEKEEELNKSQIEDALGSCMLHRASTLHYEQNYTLKTMLKEHETQLEGLKHLLDGDLLSVLEQVDDTITKKETAAIGHFEKMELLDRNFKLELDKIRTKYEEFFVNYEKQQTTQVDNLRQELDIRKNAELQAIGTERDYHSNHISQIHDKTISEVQEYFDRLLSDTAGQITSLEERIKNVQDKHASVKKDIQVLQKKTECEEQPLEQAEMERLHLIQEVQKVDIGIIAHKNFKESSKELDFKVNQIRKDIKTHERLIKKLLHDQERLSDLINETSKIS